MYNIDQKALAQEIVAYRFPEGGGEYIKSQIARHQSILEKDPETTSDLLEYNEEIFTSNNMKAILGKDDNDNPIYMAQYSNGIITKEEIDELYMTQDLVDVFILHHTDLDGTTAASIAGRVFKDLADTLNKDVVYFHYNYKETLKQSVMKRLNNSHNKSAKTFVIIVDLGFNENDLNMILSLSDRVIFIDHHKNSLEALMKCNIPDTTKVTFLIDTRYSAAYLAYILFANIIKECTGLEIKETFPAMVSVMDNAQTKIIQYKYISVKVTEDNLEMLKDVEYVERGAIKNTYILKDPRKLLGKYICIKNHLPDNKDEYPMLGLCGMDINNYFIESRDLYPFIYNFYDKILTDDNAIYDIIKIGRQLKEIERQKMTLLGYKDNVYNSSFLGQEIHGIVASDFNVFSVINGVKTARVLMRYETNTLLSACIKSYNSILRNTSLGEIITDFFPYTTKLKRTLGHKNMASILTSTKRICYIFDGLLYKTLPLDFVSKYPNIYEIFNKLHVNSPESGPRNTELYKKFFVILSIIVFLGYQANIQNSFEVQNGE